MSYVHHVPGRLRIRGEGVKRDLAQKALTGWLQSLEGVERVDVSPITGSILIRYRASAISGNHLLALLRDRGCLGAPATRAARKRRRVERAVTNLVARRLAEIAIERCLAALVAAVL